MTDTTEPQDEPTPPAPPATVVQALHRVMAEIGGVVKLTPQERGRQEKGVNYPYRGIDDIAAKAQPLLGRYGVVIVPEVREMAVQEVMVGQPPKPWTEHIIEVMWTLYGPSWDPSRAPGEGNDVIVAYTTGQGRDNADKGINKAMTGAFKNLLLRILCIGDPADDADHERHENASHPTGQPDDRPAPPGDVVSRKVAELAQAARDGDETAKRVMRALLEADPDRERGFGGEALDDAEWREQVEAIIERVSTVAAQDAAVDPEASGEPPPVPDEPEAVPTEDIEVVERVERPPESGDGSGKQAWIQYTAVVLGVGEDSLDGLTRQELIEACDEAEQQPPDHVAGNTGN